MTVAAQVRRGRKFDQVLDGARQIFMRDGFEGASVDDIAQAAGVSKATLYNYFADKRLLFMEVLKSECCRQADKAGVEIDETAGPEAVMTYVGHRLLSFFTSEMGQQIYRICIAESQRFPELGQTFFTSGPEVMVARLSAYFEGAEARGELRIADRRLAAMQFADLCKSDLWMQIVLGIRKEITQDERNYIVENAVQTFLARYG